MSSRQGQVELEGLSWLSPQVVLLAVKGDWVDSEPGPVQAWASSNGDRVEVECSSLLLADNGNGNGPATLMVLLARGAGGDPRVLGSVTAGTSARQLELPWRDHETLGTDMKTFLRRFIAPRDADVRNNATDFLARAADMDASGTLRRCEALHRFREALRERLDEVRDALGDPRGLVIEHILAVDEGAFYVQGWMRDEQSEIVRLTAVSPEGARCELAERAFRYPRADVEQLFTGRGKGARDAGFLCYFETGSRSLLPEGWIFEMENAEGTAIETHAPRVMDDMDEVRDAIFNDPYRQRLPNPELMVAHVHPALGRIQERVQEMIEIDTVSAFGRAPEAPEVSIVVPIYRRIDHLEMQLAEFADDPQVRASDLIYVLDSPEQADAMLDVAAQLYPIYRIPFRVAVLARNVGFAGANNAGVSLARGRLLLLMNSDVFPTEPGWLEAMIDYYDSKPDIGALGPKLLYEDDSIQHAGMYFFQAPGSDMWLDAHLFKGLHRRFAGANVPRPVPAVSGACMMVERELYDRLGLRGAYVRGDYEDFDLCLRLIEDGRENWYLPDAELYHLEAQSYTGDLRLPANRYNMWLNSHLWGDRIPDLMARYEYLEELAPRD